MKIIGTFDLSVYLMDGTSDTYSGNSSDYVGIKNQKICSTLVRLQTTMAAA